MSVWANAAPAAPGPRAAETVVIVGGGPAGLTAALYAARADLEPLVIEGLSPGGQLQRAEAVEAYPGVARDVSGPELVAELRAQAAQAGARFLTRDVERIDLGRAGEPHRLWAGDDRLTARALILAMGARARQLGVPGEVELGGGGGVAGCAACEAPLYAGRAVVVIGGGDTAHEEALALARHARRVVLVHRRRDFAAAPILRRRVAASARIEVLTPFVVTAFTAGADGRLAAVVLRDVDRGEPRTLAVDGAFVAIGHEPRTELLGDRLAFAGRGTLACRPGGRATSVAGVFACGDLVDHRYRQAVTAAASGCEAALDAQRYLAAAEPA